MHTRMPTRRAKDFAAYQADGGYALLAACLDGKRTRDDLIKIRQRRRVCADLAAPDFRPAANGRWCARKKARA